MESPVGQGPNAPWQPSNLFTPVGCSTILQVAWLTFCCIGASENKKRKYPSFCGYGVREITGELRAAMHARMAFSGMQQQRFISPDRIKRLSHAGTCYPAHFFLVPAR